MDYQNNSSNLYTLKLVENVGGEYSAENLGSKSLTNRHACCVLAIIMSILGISGFLFFCLFLKPFEADIKQEGSGTFIEDFIEENVWDDQDNRILDILNATYDEKLLTDNHCNGSTISELQRDMILVKHNELRRSLAFGKQRNKQGLMNSARNMYKLDWDCELENTAENWTQNCPQFYIPNDFLGSNAQLFKRFWFHFDGKNSTEHMINSMDSWWKQGEINGNDDEKNRFYAKKNYFGWANMAKGKTHKIGCSYVLCPDEQSAMFTCLYNEKAQCEREMIYENGKPCCNDSDCFTYPGSKCLLPEGLCEAPRIPKDNGVSNMCNNPQMSDMTRMWTLEQHNFYRSRLAKGLEWNGETNSTQPRARQMIKMEYDCDLEFYAQEWANNCQFAHSSIVDRPNQGQNLYMSTFMKPDPRSLIHTAVEKWWQELEEFGTPPDNMLTPELWKQKGMAIGHYTQMAWDRTYKLGCGIANCPKMSFVVCHYGPAGNRKNRKIYEIGDPCKVDTDCPGGTFCELRTSLCVISDRFKKY